MPAKRTVNLSGKINVVFTELGNNQIQVSVNTRYILNGKIDTQRVIIGAWTVQLHPYTETFSTVFNTGQPSGGCAAKNTLEKLILDKIENEMMRTN